MIDGSPERKLSHVCLMAHKAILEQMEICKKHGSTIEWDKDAGTLIIKYGDLIIVQALQKEPEGAWITNFYSNDSINWEKPDGV